MIVDILCVKINSFSIGFVAPKEETAQDEAVAAGFDLRLRPVKGSLEAVLYGIPADGEDAVVVMKSYVGAARGCTPVHRSAQPRQLGILSDGDNKIRLEETRWCEW